MKLTRLLARVEAVLDASGVPDRLEALMPTAGPSRQLPVRTVLCGVVLAIARTKVAHLASVHRLLSDLPLPDQLRLRVAVHQETGIRQATYRQFEHAFSLLVAPIDPSPVPSFRRVATNERASHLVSLRRDLDIALRQALLDELVDALVEASIPETDRYGSSVAVDWTDHETWARPRARDDPIPCADPDAAWGHAKRNAPGARDGLFFGYYAQVVVTVTDEGQRPQPELIRRVVVKGANCEPVAELCDCLARMASGVMVGDVLADAGYSFKCGFAPAIHALGAVPVMELHPFDRGPKGTFAGATLANGSLYCPMVPELLTGLGPLARNATDDGAAIHQRQAAELDRYRFVAHTRRDADGFQRFCCPAEAGKVRCPHVPASLAGDFSHPTIVDAPDPVPPCCSKRTITVPPTVNAKTRQKHPYPSAAFVDSYARRTGAERAFSGLSDPAGEGIRRGWCRLLGTAKNALAYALGAIAHNIRILWSKERSQTAQPSATGPRSRRRERRGTRLVLGDATLPRTEPDTG